MRFGCARIRSRIASRDEGVYRVRVFGIDSGRVAKRIEQSVRYDPNWQFARDVWKLIWEYRWYSLAIILVTILQEVSALWPVSLLGDLVDRLESGNLGYVVWLLAGTSLLYPAILRGNVMLRHKMFYETDFQKRVELTLQTTGQGKAEDAESAGAMNARIANAVSGITNAAYHVLGSFTPVIIKIVVVSGSLLAYNRVLGLTYLGSLVFPALMTVLFNHKLQVLRDAQYSVISKSEGVVIKAITRDDNEDTRHDFVTVMRERKGVLIALLNKHQFFLYLRQAVLIGSQFMVVFIALAMRAQLHLTPGDFTRIIGYTAQVAAAFIEAAACLDAIISYSRAYHVYAQARVH
jgi:ABC-type multidrug transport system fused ATPase/permease subunit